jgi:nudix motif 8
MEEEIGLGQEAVSVVGILRCEWGEITAITGIAVTPVVGFVGELEELTLRPNEDEVSEVFTVPLVDVLNKDHWVHPDNSAPIFSGGPHIIWGLTAYILDRFVKDVLSRYRLSFRNDDERGGEEDRIVVERKYSSFSEFKF